MASRMSSNDEQPISEINVTPFVDIILVVLIIFMVTTPIIMNPSVHVNLPKASSGDQTVPSQLNISIDKTGACFFNGKQVSNEELSKLSKDQVTKNADVQAVISADTVVQHGRVIEVLDAVKSAGVVKFAISISKK